MTEPAPPAPLRDAELDRIVEGGLSPAELREALARLGREPDGWKRCALAFLEAQAWRESFRAIGGPSRPPSGAIARRRSSVPRPEGRSPTGWRRIAAAASVAAASFALGWCSHPGRPPSDGTAPIPRVARGNPIGTPGAARMPDLPVAGDGPRVPRPDVPAPLRAVPPVVTVGRLRVGPSGEGPAVPILAGPGIDEQWVRNQPSPLTEHQVALLERQGYQVERRRRIVSAMLADGRRVAVPVDQVQVRFTGSNPL